MTQFEFCTFERDGRLARLTLNRPGVLNALHPPAHHELGTAIDSFAADPDLWVMILTGAGERAFCTGTDLKFRARAGTDDYPDSGFAGVTGRFDLDKPIIAAVNGLALGGGLEMVLACDIAVTDERAEFGFPEPLVGLAAMGGGLHRLARQIPWKQAMGIALTGQRFSASDALRYGIVNDIAPHGETLALAEQWAEQILRCAPLAIRATKAVMRDSLAHADLSAAIARRYPAAERMEASEDAVEGPRAFAAKRAPTWTGR